MQQPAVKERYNRKVAIAFTGGAAALVVAAVLGAMVFYSGEPKPPARAVSVVDPVASPVSASPTVAPPSPSNDRPLPYTADAAGSCLPEAGSTAAQTMSGEDPYAAFVCARGGADGQVINIDLGKTYAVTAISLTPGWIGPDRSGTKQWGQHRVVTTVQYLFNDTNATLVTQETKNVHGEAVQPIRPPALASRVQMLIRQTSRPPIEPESAPTSSPGPLGVLSPPPAFGGFGDGNRNTDPVDATFAISSLKIIGYDPLEHP
ncbi:hypothetical protein KIH27_20275 [Mycobacterium sp. M1]|uniref:F5/8 type C domain-containing protein n=1 Tax=Mycolicibacter acidiphilus TaxID=2835306 RepID=A0ABS5RNN4_9MYCO|nr:hypothetical protein [Mycolicibacter acidiphilus]MBS9535923.1 hypothetical protein [Mycolicibacter acidiphilus]